MAAFIRLLLWGIIWVFLWVGVMIVARVKDKEKKNNCFTWAIDKWEREDGYLVIRWCRSNALPFIRWPHFLWLPADKHQELHHFLPVQDDGEKRHFPDLVFDGSVQVGDPEDTKEN